MKLEVAKLLIAKQVLPVQILLVFDAQLLLSKSLNHHLSLKNHTSPTSNQRIKGTPKKIY